MEKFDEIVVRKPKKNFLPHSGDGFSSRFHRGYVRMVIDGTSFEDPIRVRSEEFVSSIDVYARCWVIGEDSAYQFIGRIRSAEERTAALSYELEVTNDGEEIRHGGVKIWIVGGGVVEARIYPPSPGVVLPEDRGEWAESLAKMEPADLEEARAACRFGEPAGCFADLEAES